MRSSPTPESALVVGVPVPGLGLLHYREPDAPPPPGARVRVPLGRRVVTGIVVGREAPGHAALRDIVEALDDEPFVPPAVMNLALWVGEYYAAGPGAALALTLPPAARQGRRSAFKTARFYERVAGAAEERAASGRGRAALRAIDDLGGRADARALAERGIGAHALRSLVRQGRVRVTAVRVDRDPFDDWGGGAAGSGGLGAAAPSVTWSAEQEASIRKLTALARERRFAAALLHGVTGSGKTEVYLALARAVIDQGRRVLVLVPEIGLTPALASVFRQRFGDRVAIQHSGLAGGERHDQWHRIRRGEVDVVVGTRSAVFAPLDAIGLIVVDEEHESSYKQDESPRYHGRDVAVVRGKREGALVVLGSATPSLESATNARAGRYALVTLTRRVEGRALAGVTVVDMRAEFARRGPDVALSGVLTDALAECVSRGEQALVLLNRRGFATVLFCRSCGASLECPRCSVALTFHRARREERCHYCNYTVALPASCGQCGGVYLEQSGIGTERVEADLTAALPGARVSRVDRDTMRRRGALGRVFGDMVRGDIDVLVGTQMIAKGHDFPGVTLVGVISADVGLGLADFRAAERTFQLITQVVGRAGRGRKAGQAIVQTLYPDHYAVRAAVAQDFGAFYTREWAFRTGMHYPPATAMINVVVRAGTMARALADAAALAGAVRARARSIKVLGPAPAAVAKVHDEYRAQFLLKGVHRRVLREPLIAALETLRPLKRRVVIDVDPIAIL